MLVVVAVIFLLVCTSVTANSLNSYTQTQKISENIQSIDNIIDPKIMDIIESINESLIKRYLETIVGYGPRLTGIYGCEKTARYIYEQFKSMNLATQYQNWSKLYMKPKLLKPKPRILHGQNVEATLPGKDLTNKNILIFNAHYDSVASPGADDDASGTVAVLAAAYALSKFQFNHTIKFIAFSGEEQGLFGSLAYVREAYENRDDILCEFNADMIGYAKAKESGKKFRMYGTKDVQWIMDDIEKVNNESNLDFNLIRGIASEGSLTGSDYASFIYYGYEAVSFWEGEWDPNMHSPMDDLENVNTSYLVNTTRLIAAALAHIADIDITYPHVRIESPQRGRIYLDGRRVHQLKNPNTILINNMWIWADVKPGDAPIKKVEFYFDNILQFNDTEPPYKWDLNKKSVFKHQIKVIAYDEKGRASDDWMNIFTLNLPTKR